MFTRRLYATGSASGNNLAQLIIPTSCRIVGVLWACRFNSITDGAQVDLELSLASASEIAVLGSQQTVSALAWEGNFVTSGLAQSPVNVFYPTDVQMKQGQILYLHGLIAGTVTYTLNGLIHFR